MRSRKVFYYMVSLLLAAMTAACTDDLGDNTVSSGMSGNLQVLVPLMHSNGTRAGEPAPAGNLTYNATEEECRINSLRLFAFPKEGKGKLLNEYLGGPGTSFYETGKFDGGVDVATYTLKIDPGTYRIYVVANMEEVLKGKTITTEGDLEEIVLNYGTPGVPGMPVCGNIPMIYEPSEETVISDKTTNITANMKFTCVKVKLNLNFDADAEGVVEALKSGLTISDISGNRLSPSTSLVWRGKFYASSSEEVKQGFSSELYNQSSGVPIAGGYYSAGEWTRDGNNANLSNKDVITINEGATAKAAPADEKKWMFQGTYYLPERYIREIGQQSYLTVNGIVGSNTNSYNIPLGHTGGTEEATKDIPTFPRGTYYEIIGNIKTLGNISLDCQTFIKPWETVSIDADFSHTTLWVNKKSASVTSIEKDFISYESNWKLVELGCDEKVDGKPLIIEAERDAEKQTISFRINPEIPISAFGTGSDKFPERGTTKIWLKANNLKKYLDVDYDVKPLFEVDPLEVVIYYENGAETNTKTFTWVTNLGGIVLPTNLTSTIGESTIRILPPSNANTAKGTFQVEATTNPVTTTVHTFQVHSMDTYDDKYIYRDIKVTVRPPVNDYRIYFRAINDRTWDEKINNSGGNDIEHHKHNTLFITETRPEFNGTGRNNDNWNDGWKAKTVNGESNNDWNNEPSEYNHNIWIYTQIGETKDGKIPEENVWHYDNVDWNSGLPMTCDETNTGWYYYDLNPKATSLRPIKDGSGKITGKEAKTPQRDPKPGETLMMFYSNQYGDSHLHRCPHHMEPGIPLFNYEDREGWILYDPTVDPYYRVYDEKPVIENVSYIIYTKFEINYWHIKYGVALRGQKQINGNWENSYAAQFEIYDRDYNSSNHKKNLKCEKDNGDWYKTTIILKAPIGNHEKNILLCKDSDNGLMLFGGRNYEQYEDTGYYDGTSWHHGKPSGVK